MISRTSRWWSLALGFVVASLFSGPAVRASDGGDWEGSATGVPVISNQQLGLGQSWTWTYFTDGDLTKVHNVERYQVVEVQGDRVMIEIQSAYSATGALTPNTRFRTDLSRCRRAFADPEHKQEFTVDLYPRQGGQWATTPYQVPSTVFEEKFNCNPSIHAGTASQYETRFDSALTPWGQAGLFQQWPKEPRSQIRAYYFEAAAGLPGVAYRKEFNPGTTDHFVMLLTGWGG